MKFNIFSKQLLTVALFITGSALYAGDPTFHIKNNSNEEIQFELLQNAKSVTGGLKTVLKSGSGKFSIDTSKPTTLHLFHCLTKKTCKNKEADKIKKAKVTFPAGKTIYVKWDGKHIKAQQGVRGKTSEGFKTDNNVKDEEFTQVNSVVSQSLVPLVGIE